MVKGGQFCTQHADQAPRLDTQVLGTLISAVDLSAMSKVVLPPDFMKHFTGLAGIQEFLRVAREAFAGSSGSRV